MLNLGILLDGMVWYGIFPKIKFTLYDPHGKGNCMILYGDAFRDTMKGWGEVFIKTNTMTKLKI